MKNGLLIAVALVGFFLMPTELDGGPWAGTVVGTAMICVGGLAALRAARKERG